MRDSLSVMQNDVRVNQKRVFRLQNELDTAKDMLRKSQERLRKNCPHDKTTVLEYLGYTKCVDCEEII